MQCYIPGCDAQPKKTVIAVNVEEKKATTLPPMCNDCAKFEREFIKNNTTWTARIKPLVTVTH